MIEFAKELRRRRIDVVAMGHDAHVRKEWDTVGIHKTAVEHSNRDAASAVASFMKTVQIEHRQLFTAVDRHLLEVLLHQLVAL